MGNLDLKNLREGESGSELDFEKFKKIKEVEGSWDLQNLEKECKSIGELGLFVLPQL